MGRGRLRRARRRDCGGAYHAAAWPLAARAEQPAMPLERFPAWAVEPRASLGITRPRAGMIQGRRNMRSPAGSAFLLVVLLSTPLAAERPWRVSGRPPRAPVRAVAPASGESRVHAAGQLRRAVSNAATTTIPMRATTSRPALPRSDLASRQATSSGSTIARSHSTGAVPDRGRTNARTV
jgi:hypothetical protein